MNAVEKYKRRREERMKERRNRFDWEENDHPRDENGRFSSSGGGEANSGALSSEKKKKAEDIIKKIKELKGNKSFTSGIGEDTKKSIDELLNFMNGLGKDEKSEVQDLLKKHGLRN